MVSGRVVATVMWSMPSTSSTSGYWRYQRWPFSSWYSASSSEMAVQQEGHQLTMRLPR